MTGAAVPVAGFTGYYVTADGRVISTKRGRKRELSTRKRSGYPSASLCEDGEITTRTVHSLVAEAFIGPRPEGMVVRHLDGNPENPHVQNLAYGTFQDNEADKERHGRRPKGSDVTGSVLTEAEVVEIRAEYARGVTQRALLERFPMHPTNMHHAIHGKTWGHIPVPDYSERPRLGRRGPDWKPSAKLSPEQAREIKRLLSSGVRRQTIADLYGVGYTTIRNIDNGTAWGNA